MADEPESVSQDEIEQMLKQAKPAAGQSPPQQPAADAAAEQSKAPQVEELQESSASSEGDAPGDESAPAAKTQPQPAEAGDDDKLLAQDDIEKLLNQAGKAKAAPAQQKQPPKEAAPSPLAGEGNIAPQDLEHLMTQAEQALATLDTADAKVPTSVIQFQLEEFSGEPASTDAATIDLIRDVELDLKIELGRTNMYLEDVLKLRRGSVVPLDKLAGDPVDIYVNDRLIARGEVLVLNDNFCVRVAELIAGASTYG